MEMFSFSWTTTFSTNGEDTVHANNMNHEDFHLVWGLETIINQTDERYQEHVSIFLHLMFSNKDVVWTDFKFSILNKEGKEIKSLKSKQPCKFLEGVDWGFHQFISKDLLLGISNGFISDDKYEILTKVTVLSGLRKIQDFSKKLEYQEPACHFDDRFWFIYEENKFADVTLIVRDMEFKAHKAILAARSPVFFVMFDHQMEESKKNQVNIPDIDPKVFEEMIHYIYTGKSPNLMSMADDLIVAADKYQLESLKVMCSNALNENLDIENAAKILVLSDHHCETQLRIQAMNFISSHAEDVMKTDGFNSLTISHPHLVAEICRVLASKLAKLDKHQDAVSSNIHSNFRHSYAQHPDFDGTNEFFYSQRQVRN